MPSSPVVVVSTVTFIDMYPLEEGKAYEFVNDIKGGVIPRIHPGVDKGIREQLEVRPAGRLSGNGFKIRLHFGSYHDVDLPSWRSRSLLPWRFKAGFMKANPVPASNRS